MEIHCEHRASPAKLDILGVYDWPTWEKEVSEFPWKYDRQETCYILRGKFIVTPDGGEPQEFSRGDLITFPAGLSCTWKILKPVEKHYAFGELRFDLWPQKATYDAQLSPTLMALT